MVTTDIYLQISGYSSARGILCACVFLVSLSSLVPRLHPAFHHLQYFLFTRMWAEPGNKVFKFVYSFLYYVQVEIVCAFASTCIHPGVCLGVFTVGILVIFSAFLMLRHCSNKGTVPVRVLKYVSMINVAT